MNKIISDIGETELLNLLKKFMRDGQINDDTAEITSVNQKLLINTDLVVENIHFSKETTTPEDIGWKAIASNVSDLICSGSEQILSFTVGLVLPPNTTLQWVEGLYTGMQAAMEEFGGEIIGGDCSSGITKMVSITAIGKLSSLRLHRGNALPGDYLVTSGQHGLSRLGLALLTSEQLPTQVKLSQGLVNRAIKAHQRPSAPQKALKKLIECKPKSLPWRAAGTDSSDGLLAAVEAICKSSHCQAVLSKSSLPKDPNWPKHKSWNEWCLNGGEDYELVLSLPKEWANIFKSKLNSIQIIGHIKEGKPNISWDNFEEIENYNSKGFNHF